MELIIILIALTVFAFIIYSVYSSRKSKYIQRKRALELKEAHMTKSMERVKTETSILEKEIQKTESRLNGELDLS